MEDQELFAKGDEVWEGMELEALKEGSAITDEQQIGVPQWLRDQREAEAKDAD